MYRTFRFHVLIQEMAMRDLHLSMVQNHVNRKGSKGRKKTPILMVANITFIPQSRLSNLACRWSILWNHSGLLKGPACWLLLHHSWKDKVTVPNITPGSKNWWIWMHISSMQLLRHINLWYKVSMFFLPSYLIIWYHCLCFSQIFL